MKKKYIILIIILVIAILSLTLTTYARYTFNSIWDYYLNSKGFYLTSDDLGNTLKKNVNKSWNGDSVYFNIKNNLNKSLITNYDINYTINCSIEGEASQHTRCTLNDTNESEISDTIKYLKKCINNKNDNIDVSDYNETECVNNGYEYKDQMVTKNNYFNIIKTDNNYEINDIVVNITLRSLTPYSKVLLGKYILHKSNNESNQINYNYYNYTNYDSLIISNSHNTSKCVNISWNSNNLRIDNDINSFNSYNTDEYDYINAISINIPSNKSIDLVYYKTNNNSYNIDSFTINECK